MGIPIYILLILVSSTVLIKAIDLFIKSSSKIARSFAISSFTISFLLIAISTSLPETIVGIISAINKTPILSYGNVIGSNVSLVTIIIAIPILAKSSISTRYIIHSKDVYYSTFFVFMPLLMAIDGAITRIDGIILLFAYLLYSTTILKRSQGLEKVISSVGRSNLKKEILIFTLSLVLLLGASEGILKSAMKISENLGWSLGFVGLTITALGTSLPEIAFAIGAVKRGEQDKILGNVIGSLVANSTFVLGITSIISPIILKGSNFGASTIFFLVLTVLLFLNFTKSKEKLDKKEAIIQLLLYLIFVFVQYKLQ